MRESWQLWLILGDLMHAQFGIVLHSSGPLCFVRIFTDFSHEFLCRRSRHGATDEGRDEERWTGLVSPLSLKPTMAIERFHKIHDVVLLPPRRRKQKIDMIQFQIEGNAGEKEFFISR